MFLTKNDKRIAKWEINEIKGAGWISQAIPKGESLVGIHGKIYKVKGISGIMDLSFITMKRN